MLPLHKRGHDFADLDVRCSLGEQAGFFVCLQCVHPR